MLMKGTFSWLDCWSDLTTEFLPGLAHAHPLIQLQTDCREPALHERERNNEKYYQDNPTHPSRAAGLSSGCWPVAIELSCPSGSTLLLRGFGQNHRFGIQMRPCLVRRVSKHMATFWGTVPWPSQPAFRLKAPEDRTTRSR